MTDIDLSKFVEVEGFNGLYLVNREGLVYTTRYKRLKARIADTNGYLSISVWKDGKCKHKRVHRLVAEAFIPNPLGYPHVNHIDSNPMNPRIENLEWCTPLQNQLHSAKAGRSSPLSARKLNAEKAALVRRLRAQGVTMREIAKRIGVSYPTVQYFLTGKTYKSENW